MDFKEGVEFARLAPTGDETWLPHVDSLGLESDRAYGVAVLEHLASEFDRRADAFKSAGASSLADYRALTGRDMPRLVLVADEFQVLFEPDDDVAQRAVQLIEHLARKGRAYWVHLVLASQHQRKGDMDGAILEYREALRLEPGNGQAHYALGSALLEQRQFPAAAAEFREALATMRSSAEAHNNLGVALASMGAIDQALENFRRAVELDPAFVEARQNLTAAQQLSR